MIKTKFWIFCVLVLVVVGANFYYTAQRLQAGVVAGAEESLSRSEGRLGATEALEAVAPREAVRSAAAIPELREALKAASSVESPPDSAAFDRVVSILGETAGRSESPLHRRIMLSTAHGTSDLHVERPLEVQAPPPDIFALRAALAGDFGSGLLLDGSELLRVVAEPVADDGTVHGAVLLGYPMDDAYLRGIAETIGADVSVVVGGSVLASTLSADQRGMLALAARRAALGRTFSFGDAGGPVSSLTAPLTGTEPASGYARKMPLGGLDDAFTVISVPSSPHFGWTEEYQTYQAIAAGLLLLVGIFWAFFVAISVNEPVRRMIAQMNRAASGDVKTRLEPSKFRGELRRMAELLNGVLEQAERKSPGLTKKEPDIASLLPDAPPELEAPAPDDFDFGFGQKAEESPAPQDASREASPPPAAVPSLDPPLDPPVSPSAPMEEAPAPSGPQVEADEDPFAVFGRDEPEEPEQAAPYEAAPPAEEDPFAAFADSAPPGDMAAAASASAEDYYEDDSTRVVSLGDMEAAAKAAEPPPPPPPPPPPAAPPAPAGPSLAPAMDDPFAAAMSDSGDDDDDYSPDATVVAKVPQALLQATARAAGAAPAQQDPDEAHFREVFRSFVTTRQKCGEPADGLTFDKFVVKLRKNRDAIKEKHGARSVRFQVYVKEGKAALKATPVR